MLLFVCVLCGDEMGLCLELADGIVVVVGLCGEGRKKGRVGSRVDTRGVFVCGKTLLI